MGLGVPQEKDGPCIHKRLGWTRCSKDGPRELKDGLGARPSVHKVKDRAVQGQESQRLDVMK